MPWKMGIDAPPVPLHRSPLGLTHPVPVNAVIPPACESSEDPTDDLLRRRIRVSEFRWLAWRRRAGRRLRTFVEQFGQCAQILLCVAMNVLGIVNSTNTGNNRNSLSGESEIVGDPAEAIGCAGHSPASSLGFSVFIMSSRSVSCDLCRGSGRSRGLTARDGSVIQVPKGAYGVVDPPRRLLLDFEPSSGRLPQT
jgi:hypothetical protein